VDRQRTPQKTNPKTSPDQAPPSPWFLWLIVAGILVFAFHMFWPDTDGTLSVSYSALREQVVAENVDSITMRGTEVTGEFKRTMREVDGQLLGPGDVVPPEIPESAVRTATSFESTIPDAAQADFIALLDRHGVEIRAEQPRDSILPTMLLLGLPFLLFVGLIFYLMRNAGGMRGGQEFFSFTRSKARLYDATRAMVTFADIAGEEQAKAELEQVVDFLKNPGKFHDLGARLPRGVLLIGPPGTGKTLLAKAVAGEAGVPFFTVSASEFVEMFVGVGAGRVRDLFQKAKEAAPSIIFIDELDAVGRQRFAGVGSGNDEREQTLNQILVEMDGFDARDEVIVLAATNRPDVLDPALLRPGRFDRQVALSLPDKRARGAILRIHTRKVPVGARVDIDAVAAATPGFSGADLANLVNEAALIAARRGKKVVEEGEFNDALDRIVLGAERSLILSDYEKRVIAYHEAGHAVVAHCLPQADPLRMISIIPRGQALGVTMQAPVEDRFNHTRGYLVGRLAILMGGRAAESLVFNEMTTGAQSDLKEATELARRMVGLWGMSDQIGPYYLGIGEQHVFLGREMAQERSLSDELLNRAERAAQALLAEAMSVATDLIEEHRAEMDRLVDALLDEETLDRAAIAAILDPTGGPPETLDSALKRVGASVTVAASQGPPA
jgi:cell division protease FtsH